MKRNLVLLLVICILLTALVGCQQQPFHTAVNPIFGLNFGPYTKDGQNPNYATVISESQKQSQLNTIVHYVNWIRTYSCTGCLNNLGSMAHTAGLKIAVGAWLSKDLVANDKEITGLIEMANSGQADMLIVGSEVLLRGDLTESQLIGYINEVKQAVPDWIPVTTDDTNKVLLQHPNIISLTDLVLANIYPYWDGVAIDKAVSSLNTQYQELKAITNGKEVIIGETGWPSSGNTIKNAVASVENEAFYFKNFVSWTCAENVRAFYFEAFDEPWKGTTQAPQESFWGLWDKNLKMKPSIFEVFDGKLMDDNWTILSTPSISTLTPTVTLEPTIIPTPIPTPKSFPNLKDLNLQDIQNYGVASYGDLDLTDYGYEDPPPSIIPTNNVTSFALNLARDDCSWGSVGIDVGSLIDAPKLDLSNYHYAIIYAKGAKGGEEFRFGLGVGPTDFYFDKGLTTNWQNIVIDISSCSRDMTDIDQIGFEIGTSWTNNKIGTKIYINGIKFSNKLPDTYVTSK